MLHLTSASSLSVTVSTDKSNYVLREIVDVFGNLTFGGPAKEGLVGIQVKHYGGSPFVMRTVPTGNFTSGWSIQILSVQPCDADGNPKQNFERGKWSHFKAVVKNNEIWENTVLITINAYDISLIPLGLTTTIITMSGGSTATLLADVWIPSWACVGNAPVYANVYTDWPENGGYPKTPEKMGNFTIIESIYEELPDNPIPQQPIENGSYRIQFCLSPEPLPGTYSINVGAYYKGYKAFNSATFLVGDIEAPPRASFIAKPPTTGPNISITFDGTFSSAEGFNDTITSYTWDFGDENTETGSIVHHSYTDLGEYLCTLNVTDSEGYWNTTSKTIKIAIIHDVAVTSIQCLNEVYNNWVAKIKVTVKNEGTLTETFAVTAYYNDSLIASKTVTDLDINQEETLTFQWNTAGLLPLTNYNITANATILTGETDVKDNELAFGLVKVKLRGDVVFDRVIDISDVVSVTGVYRSEEGDPNWNPAVDLVIDGIIDIADVVTVTSIYRTTY